MSIAVVHPLKDSHGSRKTIAAQSPGLQTHSHHDLLRSHLEAHHYQCLSCCLLQVFFPLLPGVESIYEPAMESAEEAMDDMKESMDHAMDSFRK